MEQNNLYDRIEWCGNTGDYRNGNGSIIDNNPDGFLMNNVDGTVPNDSVLRKTILSNLICPSSGHEGLAGRDQLHGYRNDWNVTRDAAITDYVGNMGHFWGGWKDCAAVPDFVGPPEWPDCFIRGGGNGAGTPWVNGEWYSDYQRLNGIFRYWGSVKMSAILDGTSNTVLAFEEMHWNGYQPSTTRLDKNIGDSAAWMCPLGATDTMRNPMNDLNPSWDQYSDRRCSEWSSNHPAGAQAVLCDGSVNFFAETIEHVTRYALSSRNDAFAVNVHENQ